MLSFYNQTKDIGIKPTPVIGGVGLILNYKNMITMDLKEIGQYTFSYRKNRRAS